jgi:hypothetical protein
MDRVLQQVELSFLQKTLTNNIGKAILEKKVTDENISSVLTLFDAANKLKSPKMTGCISILGHGLEPLRESSVIQRLDLVIERHRKEPYYEFQLSEQNVLPILHDIIGRPNCSLQYLQLPRPIGITGMHLSMCVISQ